MLTSASSCEDVNRSWAFEVVVGDGLDDQRPVLVRERLPEPIGGFQPHGRSIPSDQVGRHRASQYTLQVLDEVEKRA